ncbi:hypothetical protein ACHAQA_001055 [Verticillium albo-atrum]
MANKPSEPLDQLQYMLNDVIIQIGKALKASTKQPNRQNVSQVHASLQTRMPETIENFHWALNDLEGEIVRAKGALQRDLDRIREKRAPPQVESAKPSPVPAPATVASPAASPVAPSPELPRKSSPSPQPKQEPLQRDPSPAARESPAPPPMAPMAPIPDMGGGSIPVPVQAEVSVKREPTPSAPQAMMAPMDSVPAKVEEPPITSSIAPEPSMSAVPEAPMDDLFDMSGGENDGGGGNGSDFDFTDMTFGLAPSNVDSQSQPTTKAPLPDMGGAGFSVAAASDMPTIDNLLPAEAPMQPVTTSAVSTAGAVAAVAEPVKPEDDQKSGEQSAAPDNDIFDLDGIGGNMDLDMNLGNNGDGSSFDEMFYGGDANMEDVQFDDAFFGLSN